MNPNFKFRSGKHQGKTLAWVEENDGSYLRWMKENRPEMLKGAEDEVKPVALTKTDTFFKLEPNMNFWNEGPDENSLVYINKHKNNKK